MAELIKRLKAGEVILGDGSYTVTLEKRGYVLANAWTPESSVEHPEAVRQLALEFARAGADITQTYTFFSDDKRLKEWHGDKVPSCDTINKAATSIAKTVAKEHGTITAGGIAMTDVYQTTRNKEKTVAELKTSTKALIDSDIDMLICEYFRNVEEMEWAIEHVKTYGKPVAATICIGPNGDEDGVPLGECAVRMAKAGADLVGLNCLFDPFIMLDCMKIMKDAMDKEGLHPVLMCQPLGYRDPDAGHFGWVDLPEFPYAIEPRQITRIEAMKYAREAYDMGIRYIGGCCGFEPYHIRAMAEELRTERGRLPAASAKSEFARNLFMLQRRAESNPKVYANNKIAIVEGDKINVVGKDKIEYWTELCPCSGRPTSAAMCRQKNPQAVQKSVVS